MIDLEAELRNYIEIRLKPFPPDQIAVHALVSRDMTRPDREADVRSWLNRYRVLRYVPPETSGKVVAAIIDFADERGGGSLRQDKTLIDSEFRLLEARLGVLLPPLPKSGKPRRVTSLTSKALWCCFPNDVPIYDNYALRALQVLSRLCHFETPPLDADYALYIGAWFALYDLAKPVIDSANLNGYRYPIRVLDQFLWYLGQPTFA